MDLQTGTVQTVKVSKKVKNHFLVTQKSQEMPLICDLTEDEISIGEIIDVFIYRDGNAQIVATPFIPNVQIGVYGWAKVVDVIPHLGVFVDIGIPKDVLLPKDDLPAFRTVWPKNGDMLLITLTEDKQGRLLAVLATEQVFMERRQNATEKTLYQKISGYVYFTSREGTAIFTDEGFRGFIHHTKRVEEPRVGKRITGRVIAIKNDGTINVSLLPQKHERLASDAHLILQTLYEHDGEIPLDDDSEPDDIRDMFGFSKSAFKRAVGRLMKEKKVKQQNGKTILMDTR